MSDGLTVDGAIFGAALLYAAVGHGGASGYIAVLSLAGMAPDSMRPLVLCMNVLVAATAGTLFKRHAQGHYALLMPLLVGSLPTAYYVGGLQLPGTIYRLALASILFLASYRMWRTCDTKVSVGNAGCRIVWPQPLLLVGIGMAIGGLAGLTGTGGGILLSPLLLTLRWTSPRSTAGISAPFVALNSLVTLLAYPYAAINNAITSHFGLIVIAAVGGLLGAGYGARLASIKILCRLLAVVLLLAASKLAFVAVWSGR